MTITTLFPYFNVHLRVIFDYYVLFFSWIEAKRNVSLCTGVCNLQCAISIWDRIVCVLWLMGNHKINIFSVVCVFCVYSVHVQQCSNMASCCSVCMGNLNDCCWCMMLLKRILQYIVLYILYIVCYESNSSTVLNRSEFRF